jgi:hypothetical protein
MEALQPLPEAFIWAKVSIIAFVTALRFVFLQSVEAVGAVGGLELPVEDAGEGLQSSATVRHTMLRNNITEW